MKETFGLISPLGTFINVSQTGSLVSTIVNLITIVSGLALLIYFAYGSLTYITSSGDDKNLAKSRKVMGNALIGFIFVISAYFVVGFVGNRLGFETIFTPSLEGDLNTKCLIMSVTNSASGDVYRFTTRLRSASTGTWESPSSSDLNGAGGVLKKTYSFPELGNSYDMLRVGVTNITTSMAVIPNQDISPSSFGVQCLEVSRTGP